MKEFAQQIAAAAPSHSDVRHRRWIFVPYDRLTAAAGPASEQAAADTGLVIVEALGKPARRPYHKRKLVLVLSSMRHFALEQAARGVSVAYGFTRGSYVDGLRDVTARYKLPSLTVMEPAEHEMRIDLRDAQAAGVGLKYVPDTTWLSSVEDFDGVYKLRPDANGSYGRQSKHFLMDRFYRHMRERTGYLMRGGKPDGGHFSYDADNRQPYRGKPPVPAPPTPAWNAITAEAIHDVLAEFPHHFGANPDPDAPFSIPLTHESIEEHWRWVLANLLPEFGPFEDAMNSTEPHMFHSRMSPLINVSRLLPRRVVEDVVAAAGEGLIPLASAEGFVRQILGWREYMRHVHRVTDGYRNIDVPQESLPANSHSAVPAKRPSAPSPGIDPQAPQLESTTHPLVQISAPDAGRPSALGAHTPLPAVYWGVKSGLFCLDTVVADVVRDGWSHHITRLMVLSNFATLAGYSPRELTDWFWIAYVDAYDWVVEPNVLGMSTFGDGGLTATKPYVSGAAYINRMSNYCGQCQFDPKRSIGPDACPYTALYWTFLERNEATLGRNPRLRMPYNTLRKKSAEDMEALRERAALALAELAKPTYDVPGSAPEGHTIPHGKS